MLINEILSESSEWSKHHYTERELFYIRRALKDIEVSYRRRGVDLTISDHVMQQLQLDRGAEDKITVDELSATFTKLANKLERMFRRSPDMAHLVIDRKNIIMLVIVQPLPRKYTVTTIIKDVEWHGSKPVVVDYL